jgi:hypothetical protein
LTEFIDDNIESLKVYPNPASEPLYILNDSSYDFETLEVLDLSGKVLLRAAPTLNLDVNSLTNGSYILRMMNDDKTYHQLFVIRH